MSNELPFTISDREPEQAGLIVANYLDQKYGAVPLSRLETALSEIFRLHRTGVRHPLLLANKAIDLIERRAEPQRAA